MKTCDLVKALRFFLRLNGGPWSVLEDVPNGTGAAEERRCDVLAMNTWPSAGLGVDGFELKVSRGDWLRELRDPGKATAVQRYCDHWWLVAGDASVCPDPAELPDGWGLLVANAAGDLEVVVQAPVLLAEPLDRAFVAALVRKIERVTDLLVAK